MELDHCSYKIWPNAGTPGESDATRHEVGGSENASGAGNQQERLELPLLENPQRLHARRDPRGS